MESYRILQCCSAISFYEAKEAGSNLQLRKLLAQPLLASRQYCTPSIFTWLRRQTRALKTGLHLDTQFIKLLYLHACTVLHTVHYCVTQSVFLQ